MLTYSYDLAGRVVGKNGGLAAPSLPLPVATDIFDADNDMTTFNATPLPTPDPNGNMGGYGTNTYTWDARNHLTGISGGATASFVYDAFGRRVQKTINGCTTSFLYDRLNPVQEIISGTCSATPANLLTGLKIDEYFTRTDGSGMGTFLADALGSTIGLVGSSGTTTYTYDPFGNVTPSGQVSANPYQFTGRENDAGTGLYYYRTRYYSPTLQRFIAQDRGDVFSGDPNLYAYAAGNPIDYGDPFGLWRLPDYTGGNINIAITNPLTGTLIGWSGTVSIDRYGDVYWSPIGIGVGKSLTVISGSLTANWLDQSCTPSRAQLAAFLSSNGFNGTIGFWGGASQSYTPGSGWSTGIGFVTPQVGASWNYSFPAGNIGITW